MVGEFGPSSPDWWMACLTLSEQDGRCAGCGPQIVTFDCFISAWFIELSSPWNEVPRRFSRPHLLPVTHSSRDCGLSGRSKNCATKPGVEASRKPDLQHQKAAVKRCSAHEACCQTTAEFLPYPGFDERLESRRRGQVGRGLLHTAIFYLDKAAFVQLSGGKWFRVFLLSTKVQRALILICHYEYKDPQRAKLSSFFM